MHQIFCYFVGKGQAKYVNKTVKNDSFFNFFAPPEGTAILQLCVQLLLGHCSVTSYFTLCSFLQG